MGGRREVVVMGGEEFYLSFTTRSLPRREDNLVSFFAGCMVG
jgi:hypothetical protein